MPDWSIISWPALGIGLILLTYWLRVLVMVRRTRRTAGHHANLIPEERIGRLIRVIWIPLVVLWVLLPLAAAFEIGFQIPILRPLVNWTVIPWIALVIAAVAFALTWVCWLKMGKSWRMGIDPNEKTQLVFSGPFAYVRHPIYGLSQVLVVMTALIVPTPAMLVVSALHILFMQWEVRREDAYLVAVHGDAYARYKSAVGRFIPRSLRPYRP
ncbi:MAG: isoprenylcysteine carboxylmethyltransferase family protein [Caldilineales bacterium]|nr:isoprenylcysteine carboxylmethyltransferase family protein [Caldilineales bacterium]